MQEKHLYEYSVIRVVLRVEREEFLNVGIIVFAKKRSHKDAFIPLMWQRWNCFLVLDLNNWS
jgi:hypothetical protein